MNCPRCAADNQVGASLCARCGSPLPADAPPPPAAYAQPGYPPPGYPPPGYAQPGYPPPGYAPGYPPYGMPFVQTRTSGMAVAGFVISLVFCGVLGLIFSIMGSNEVKRGNGTVTGGGLALAGIIIGIVRIVIEVIYIVLIVAVAGGNAHIG